MKTVMEVAAHAAPDATGDDVKKEDESTPPWLQSAVDRLAAEMVTERNGGAVDAAGVVTDVSVGQRATRSWLLLLVAPVVVAASIAVALFAIRTPGPESTASASGFSAALAVQGVSANHEQQMLGALSRRALVPPLSQPPALSHTRTGWTDPQSRLRAAPRIAAHLELRSRKR
jgi:hypothetical protein